MLRFYRLNCCLHYLREIEPKVPLHRMPNFARIQKFTMGFKSIETYCFGGLTFAMPIVASLLGQHRAAAVSDVIDSAFRV
jgi:hypothetical protein